MFQPSNDNKNNEKIIEKNLKMMSLSAIVLIVLFMYTLYKSDSALAGTSYYVGIAFLFMLLIATFALQKYKHKIRKYIPENRFQSELTSAKSEKVKDVSDKPSKILVSLLNSYINSFS